MELFTSRMRKRLISSFFSLSLFIYILGNEGFIYSQGYPPGYVNNSFSPWAQPGASPSFSGKMAPGPTPWEYGGSFEQRGPLSPVMAPPGSFFQPQQVFIPPSQNLSQGQPAFYAPPGNMESAQTQRPAAFAPQQILRASPQGGTPWQQPSGGDRREAAFEAHPEREDHPVYRAQLIPMRKDPEYSQQSEPLSGNTPQERYQALLQKKAREKASLEPWRTEAQPASAEVLPPEESAQPIIVHTAPSSQETESSAQVAEQDTSSPASVERKGEGQQIEQLEQKVKSLETERDGLKSFVQTLMQRVEKAQQIEKQWAQLIREKEELREMFSAMEQEVKEARQKQYQVEELEAQRDRAKVALQELENKLGQSEGAQKRIKQLESERDQMQAILGSLDRGESATSALMAKIKDLEAERNQLRAALDEKQSQELNSMSAAVQMHMRELEAENVELKQTVAQLTHRVEELTTPGGRGVELGSLSQASQAEDLNFKQAQQVEEAEVALRQARELAQQAQATLVKNRSSQGSPSQRVRTATHASGSSTIVKQVVIKSSSQRSPTDAKASKDSVVVQVPELSAQAVEIVRGAAQGMVGKVLTVDNAQRLGKIIGSTLKDNGLAEYDVVLPKQDMSRGTVLVEVRRGS